jgi:hypothetical protein
MSDPILHVAAFWCDDDHADEIADFCKRFKVEGSRGAVVTFSVSTADRPDFRHTMSRLQLAEINSRPDRPAA